MGRPAYRALLHDALADGAEATPDKVAVHVGDEQLTYAELASQSDRLAAALQQRGVRRGDRVAIFMDNTLACAPAIYAVLKVGGVFVMVNPQTKHDKLRFICNDCSVRALITDSHLAPVAGGLPDDVPSVKSVLFSGDPAAAGALSGRQVEAEPLAGVLDAAPAAPQPPGTIPSDLAALIYTSGSTGNPKGVMHSHQSMTFASGSLVEYQRLAPDDVMLNVLPMAFDYGLYQLLMAVRIGATLVLERSFTYPAEVFARMREHDVTHFPGVPTVYAIMIAAHRRSPLSFPSVRRVTNTAAALPPAYLETLREIFPNALIFSMYGLTECKRVSYLPPEWLERKPGSVGIAIPGTEVYLRSPEGEAVPVGEPGILHVRGPHLMRGYWNNPERTAKILHPGELEGERVLCTGDWFRMDEDGCLYFLSRSDDIIKTRGEKVSPAEVEAALCSIPGVREAVVVGVPDPTLGQAVKAFVVPAEGAALDPRRLRFELTQRLENFMVPQEVVVLEEFPKTPNGKIDRKALQ
ncbi:AMP-binding protein [Thioalkalivibrio sp. XN8]|uniref:class I adenylate-forming enzyme family protein n=1 Tax=Thioalkalivibrio sp. XN8 TaxID=2712863 RepID=UPI0013EDD110|nr:AMP-binding protein [Thioalkalivibrio sp. XN8]NGP53683.1 AMP-binding protein [Thioalkalivibrio sp. XN8]